MKPITFTGPKRRTAPEFIQWQRVADRVAETLCAIAFGALLAAVVFTEVIWA